VRIALWLGFALLVPAAGSVAAPGLKPAPPKPSPLVGDWEPVPDAAPAKPAGGPRLTVTFTPDGKLKYDDGRSDPEWGWYKADADTDPPRIDFATRAVAARPNTRKPYLGIYRLDGDVLTICCAEGDRPTAFEVPAGSKVMRFSYRRVKKD
jgi:uncharacterized protein (TIGR03067 family)